MRTRLHEIADQLLEHGYQSWSGILRKAADNRDAESLRGLAETIEANCGCFVSPGSLDLQGLAIELRTHAESI